MPSKTARELNFFEKVHLPPPLVMCHVSHVMCTMSHVTCHMSNFFGYKYFLQCGGGSFINGAYPAYFLINTLEEYGRHACSWQTIAHMCSSMTLLFKLPQYTVFTYVGLACCNFKNINKRVFFLTLHQVKRDFRSYYLSSAMAPEANPDFDAGL